MSAQAQGEVEVFPQPICNLIARGGSGWSAPFLNYLTPWKDLVGTHCAQGWEVLRAGLDRHGKSCLHHYSILSP